VAGYPPPRLHASAVWCGVWLKKGFWSSVSGDIILLPVWTSQAFEGNPICMTGTLGGGCCSPAGSKTPLHPVEILRLVWPRRHLELRDSQAHSFVKKRRAAIRARGRQQGRLGTASAVGDASVEHWLCFERCSWVSHLWIDRQEDLAGVVWRLFLQMESMHRKGALLGGNLMVFSHSLEMPSVCEAWF